MPRSRFHASERATLDPFEALAGDVPPRDQRDLMERPFFSLAKAKRVKPILYKASGTEVQVYAVPEHGLATIWDADILIWAGSHIVEALDRGLPTSRFFRFTPYQLLTAIGRATGNREYQLLKGALTRLQSTVIRTTIRHGEQWRRQQFSWINEWEELTTAPGRCEGMEFVLPDWFYQGVLDRRLVLTIDPAYFRLTGGIERWLYRVARKHAGRQPEGWRFDLKHLHAKSASQARFSDFALDLRRIVARQPLPGYALALEHDETGRALIAMRPMPLAAAVDKLGTSEIAYRDFGRTDIGTSGASLSGLRAHADSPGSQLSLELRADRPDSNFPNSESNFVVGADHNGGKRRAGTGGAP
ncbi:replication initiator protein A [Tistrella mobilis]|uniref:Replication protein A n=1 Tax=Tistrella mobilis (strain KA081020-065) TaxID=1110502 RepID=I3TMQ4_TISMK|nr:replication initiator protein A [Tistrella mobilis]AFK54042.1 replication protein A [Tistrella mobilis KA081020-065]